MQIMIPAEVNWPDLVEAVRMLAESESARDEEFSCVDADQLENAARLVRERANRCRLGPAVEQPAGWVMGCHGKLTDEQLKELIDTATGKEGWRLQQEIQSAIERFVAK